ncbi:hypothetical protein TNCV_5117351 [Trichonephila clavipes]|nr:hypothetical protein TNCV_5117351 [Trichonephila clavipes]
MAGAVILRSSHVLLQFQSRMYHVQSDQNEKRGGLTLIGPCLEGNNSASELFRDVAVVGSNDQAGSCNIFEAEGLTTAKVKTLQISYCQHSDCCQSGKAKKVTRKLFADLQALS